jgi:hypothetical protein
MATRPLSYDDFDKRRGQPFAVQAGGGVVQLVLAEIQELPGSSRTGGGFRLEFRGPPEPLLGQGTFRFLVGGEPFDIFIVPVGTTPQHMRYEAIFF